MGVFDGSNNFNLIIMWNLICSNRLLDQKIRQEEYRRHRKSVRNVKPLIVIEPPPTFAFLAAKPKKTQMQQQHLREISIANTDLIRRMTSASKKDSSLSFQPDRLSLNQGYSKRVSSAINKENQKLLQRLRDTSSFINFSKLEKEHQLTERLKNNLSRTRPNSSNTKRSYLRPQSAR